MDRCTRETAGILEHRPFRAVRTDPSQNLHKAVFGDPREGSLKVDAPIRVWAKKGRSRVLGLTGYATMEAFVRSGINSERIPIGL